MWDQTQTRVETRIIWIPAMPLRVYKEARVFFNTVHITYFTVHFFCLILHVLFPFYFIYLLFIFFLLFSYCYCKAKWIFSDYFLSLCLPTVWTRWISKLNKFDIVWWKILRDRPLEKLWGGGGELFSRRNFFSAIRFHVWIFLKPWHEYFSGLIGVHEFFFI